jgi:type IV secretion system protein VirB10
MWTRFLCAFLVAGCAVAQTPASSSPQPATGQAAAATSAAPAGTAQAKPAPAILTIPSGTKVPLALKQAISTKTAKEGDPVYCETTFPFVVDDRIVIPAGTYVQGKISRIQRAGRVKGRAELLMHFTSMIYPSGYTVMLPGSVESVPGAEKTSVKDAEGTVRQDSEKGKDVATVASTASTGAVIGGLASRGSGKGVGIGAAAGGLAGLAIAMLSRGNDVRLEPGTSIEMIIQRQVTVDASRMQAAK